MARKSFTLQKEQDNVVVYRPNSIPASVSFYGTYTKYLAGSEAASFGYAVLEDDDTRLKSEGLLVAPLLNNPTKSGELLPYISFFEVNVVDYNEVELTWDAPLSDLSLIQDDEVVVATKIVIVYSDSGEPQTVGDGAIIVNDNISNNYYHYVPSGKWAYYSLFVKFESKSGDLYYEPAAKIGVLTPLNHGSVDDLYKRVPEYYRLLDEGLDQGDGGPLYKYLSIFGYEIDRVKTIIDYMMVMKDPQIANSEALDYISQDLGVGLRVHELGASRLRTLINIIGFLRRSEGTKTALELAVQALTGSDVVVDEATHTIKVYAQRVNLLKDPDLAVLIAGSLDAGSASSIDEDFNYELDAGQASTSVFLGDPYDGGSASATGIGQIDENQQPVWAYYQDPESGGSAYILQSNADYIRVKTGDYLYFSMQHNPTSGAQDEITKVELIKNTGTSNLPEFTPIASSTVSTIIAGIRYWVLEVADGYPDYVDTYIYVHTTEAADADNTFKQMLLERSIGGPYFDGNTSIGGWLINSYESPTTTVSDYRWFNPENPDSSTEKETGLRTDTYSVYSSNYSKTRAVVRRLVENYLPVTELTSGTAEIYANRLIETPKWSITYNHIYGVHD